METYLVTGKISTSRKRVYALQSTKAGPKDLQQLPEEWVQQKAERTVTEGTDRALKAHGFQGSFHRLKEGQTHETHISQTSDSVSEAALEFKPPGSYNSKWQGSIVQMPRVQALHSEWSDFRNYSRTHFSCVL